MNLPAHRWRLLLRILSGLLALLAFGLVILRLVALSRLPVAPDDALLHSLRLLFPASLGLLLGYIALFGRLPFSHDRRQDDPTSRSP